MMKFSDIKWARRSKRGLSFGWHGKSYVYLPDQTEIVFTAKTELMNWSFKIGASWGSWWRPTDFAVLTDSDGKVYPLYGFVTKDGKEPASRPEGHWDGRERVGLPMDKALKLTLHGGRKIRVQYSAAELV